MPKEEKKLSIVEKLLRNHAQMANSPAGRRVLRGANVLRKFKKVVPKPDALKE